MSLKKIMHSPVVTVSMDTTLAQIKNIFDAENFRHLFVLEHKKLIGVISDRDMFRALSPYVGTDAELRRDRVLLSRKAHQIMTRDPIVVELTDDVFGVIERLLKRPISCVPVVNDDYEPIGVISWRDILKELAARKPEQKT